MSKFQVGQHIITTEYSTTRAQDGLQFSVVPGEHGRVRCLAGTAYSWVELRDIETGGPWVLIRNSDMNEVVL